MAVIGKIGGSMLKDNLLRYNVDLIIDGNLMYYDTNNRRVGINTIVPGNALTVNGTTTLGNVFINNNTVAATGGNLFLYSYAGNIDASNQRIGNIATPIYTNDAATKSYVDNISSVLVGNAIPIGIPTDGNLTTNAAYGNWSSTTTITDAIDNLNTVALNIAQNTFVGNVIFSANIVAGASPQTIRFTANASGNPNGYYWDFGDGTTATNGAVVSHTYSNVAGGTFTVYHREYNTSGTNAGANGSVGSSSDYLRPNYIVLYTPNPIPSFTANVASQNSGTPISITNSSQYATSYIVYWGDGTTTTNLATSGTSVHTFTNSTGDTQYSIILRANSSTAGPGVVSVNSAATTESIYSTHTPLISANVTNVINLENAGGGGVRLTNGTTSGPGSASVFGAQQKYSYWWGDTTSNSNVAIGSGGTGTGDTSGYIDHIFALSAADQASGTTRTFNTSLFIYNGHTSSPFNSSNVTITVQPSVRSNIQIRANTISDKTGDTAQTGYVFTDYNGNNRALFTGNTYAQNATIYNWIWGDSTSTGNLSSGAGTGGANGNITHSYTSTGSFTSNLTVYGTPGTTFQSNSKTTAITISANPSAPGAVSSKTISPMATASVGNSPYLAAGARDNTGGNIVANGTSVTRYTTSTTTANSATFTQANTSAVGNATVYFNGVADGTVIFSNTTSNIGTFTSLSIVNDSDAHTAISAATYPTGFYKVFDARVSKTLSGVSIGYNDAYIAHTSTGATATAAFVKDDLTSSPTLVTSGATVANVAATTIRYVSGIPYYQAGGNVSVANLAVYNWIGQTYNNANGSPFAFTSGATVEGTSGTLFTSQTQSYTLLNGSSNYLTSGVPQANIGNNISNYYTFGTLYFTIGTTAAAVGNANVSIINVNGTSTIATLNKYLNVYGSAYSGLDETSITSTITNGGSANSEVAKRIAVNTFSGQNPTFANTGSNYYTGSAWSGAVTIAGTDEAVIRWGNLTVNTTDYSSNYLPVGPNLSSSRSSPQYFRFAVRRTSIQGFSVTLTGKVSGFWIAVPGTAITSASGLNGWLDASTTWGGAGVPGSGTGGNGSDGCAKTAGDRIVIGTTYTSTTFNLTLGTVSTSNGYGSQILFSIKLATGDYITSLSVGP